MDAKHAAKMLRKDSSSNIQLSGMNNDNQDFNQQIFINVNHKNKHKFMHKYKRINYIVKKHAMPNAAKF